MTRSGTIRSSNVTTRTVTMRSIRQATENPELQWSHARCARSAHGSRSSKRLCAYSRCHCGYRPSPTADGCNARRVSNAPGAGLSGWPDFLLRSTPSGGRADTVSPGGVRASEHECGAHRDPPLQRSRNFDLSTMTRVWVPRATGDPSWVTATANVTNRPSTAMTVATASTTAPTVVGAT